MGTLDDRAEEGSADEGGSSPDAWLWRVDSGGEALNDSTLLDLVGSLYEAANDPAHWTVFLEQLARELRGNSATLLSHDADSPHPSIVVSWGIDPYWDRLYAEHYGSVNVWVKSLPADLPVYQPIPSEELVPESELERTEYYNDFLRPQHVFRHCCVALVKTPTAVSGYSVQRPRSEAPFAAEEERVFAFLAPHMRRALQLYGRLTSLASRENAAQSALESLEIGVIFLSPEGRVVEMNRVARALAAARDGILVDRGELRAIAPVDRPRLSALVASALSPLGAGGSTAITRRGGLRPLEVTVSQLPRDNPMSPRGGPGAVVFVRDPERVPRLAEDHLRTLFHLSPAESRLALELVAGRTLEEAADSLGCSLETARTHSKHILAKTGVRRQTELVALLLRGLGALAGR